MFLGSKLSVSEKTRLKGLQIKTVATALDKNYSRADNLQEELPKPSLCLYSVYIPYFVSEKRLEMLKNGA